jgi:hypothetical protein
MPFACHIGRVIRLRPLRSLLALSFALVGLLGCPTGHYIPEPEIPEVKGSEWCDDAEKNLLALGCEEGQPTKRGKSFTEFCIDTQKNGGIDLNPKCLATIKSCDEIDKVCAWNQ